MGKHSVWNNGFWVSSLCNYRLGNLSGFAAFASIVELLNVDSKRPGKSIIKPIPERTQGSLSLYMLLVAETFDDWVTNNCWTHLVRVSSHGTPTPPPQVLQILFWQKLQEASTSVLVIKPLNIIIKLKSKKYIWGLFPLGWCDHISLRATPLVQCTINFGCWQRVKTCLFGSAKWFWPSIFGQDYEAGKWHGKA
jgi:hypothetical protein